MQGVVFGGSEVKKVLKVKLEPEVHEKFRTWAFNHRVTMQGELENYVGGLVNGGAPKTPQAPRKEPSIRSYEVKKVEVGKSWGEVGEAPKTPPVAVSEPAKPALREGYSWCTACGKNQVKLPLFLCNDCRGDK